MEVFMYGGHDKKARSAEQVITIETDAETVVLWDEASAIDPAFMRDARVLSKRDADAGQMRVTIAIPQSCYESTLIGMEGDADLVSGAIEAVLIFDACAVLRKDRMSRAVLAIPFHIGPCRVGHNTVGVNWHLMEASDVLDAIRHPGGADLNIVLKRISAIKEETALFAVTCPPQIIEERPADASCQPMFSSRPSLMPSGPALSAPMRS
jgi:hypothetical protein